MIYCFIYSKKGINAIALCISILIYFSLSFIFPKTNSNVKVQARLIQVETVQDYVHNNNWFLRIPKIELEAEIKEGTDSVTLNNSIGHFIETNKDNGNIGLAAHNRGYDVNYFKRIKELQIGDEIFYSYKRE
ncbi:MAG: sortase [Clostridia bacterium]|nr:sortase [Clostridia bacterium]